MEQGLFIIMLWDAGFGRTELYGYAIAAEDQAEAEETAIQKHKAETVRDNENAPIRIDRELCFQATCAPDQNGQLFDIHLVKARPA